MQVDDLNELAPSTNIVIPSPHQTSFSIRGIGNNPANDGLEQSAGVFLDGVYLARSGQSIFDLADIDRMELLRGPQGTLFGKNTTAGALSITTAKPTFLPSAMIQATAGNLGYQQYQGYISGPLIDHLLAGRLTLNYTHRDGSVTDTTLNEKVGRYSRQGVRGQLLFTPNDALSLRVIADFASQRSNGGSTFQSAGATPASWQKDLTAAGGVVDIDPKGETTAANSAGDNKTRQNGVSAETNWHFGNHTLTSISAYRQWHYYSNGDAEGSSADVMQAGHYLTHKQLSEELRLANDAGGKVDWVAGLYYLEQQLRVDQYTDYGSQAAAYLSGMNNATLNAYAPYSSALKALLQYNNSKWDMYATPNTDSYAAFGQATWHVNDQWNLTAGLRETYETKRENVWRTAPIDLTTDMAKAGLAYNTVAPIYAKVQGWSPSALLSADYKPHDGLMFYALASTGQKAGGVNASLPATGLDGSSLEVKPETAYNLEAGIKSDWLNHQLTIDANLFHTDITDYQATFYMTPAGSTSTVQVLTNVGRVRTQGVEMDATARPVHGLSLTATISYNDAIYGDYKDGPCPAEITTQKVCDLSGRPVSGAPKWIVNLRGEYSHAISARLTGFIAGETSSRSSYYGYLDDSQYTRTGDYTLVNLRTGIRSQAGNWTLYLWGKNIGGTRYTTSYINLSSLAPGSYSAIYGDPRTYGVTLRASF